MGRDIKGNQDWWLWLVVGVLVMLLIWLVDRGIICPL